MEAISTSKETLDLILQLLLIVVPVIVSWYARTYIKNTAAEKQIGAIVRLAGAAIDYVEDLDKRGDLVLSPGSRKSIAKLNQAAEWMESELHRNGIKISTEEAQNWISSEFQKRIGKPQSRQDLAEQASTAVNLLQSLEGEQFYSLMDQPERLAFLAQFAADWMISRNSHIQISKTEAMSWINAEILQRLQPEQLPSDSLPGDPVHQVPMLKQGLSARGLVAEPLRELPAAEGTSLSPA